MAKRKTPFTARPYKGLFDQKKWEIVGPAGKAISLPMDDGEANMAMFWLKTGYNIGLDAASKASNESIHKLKTE